MTKFDTNAPNFTRDENNVKIEIPTIDFIKELCIEAGFKLIKELPLSVPKNYMIHSKNAMKKESILYLKKLK